MYKGLLIKESLQDETILDLITVTNIELWKTDNDPRYWTAINFEAEDPFFPEKLSRALIDHPSMPWYVDFKVEHTKYIVLKDHVLTYKIGDSAARQNVMDECLRYGIRADQLDWNE